MENEQTHNESTILTPANPVVPGSVKESVQDAEVKSEWSAPSSKEEYEKALQSERSKAKNDILKTLGINDVNDYKAKVSTYDAAIKKESDLEKTLGEYKEKVLLFSNNVSEEYKDDFLTLVKAKAKSENDYDTVAKDILQRNPIWNSTNNSVQIGNDKSESKAKVGVYKHNPAFTWLDN